MLDCRAMEPSVSPRRPATRADYDACVRLQREVWGLARPRDHLGHPARSPPSTPGACCSSPRPPGEGIVGFSYGFAALRATATPTCTPTCSPCARRLARPRRRAAPQVGAARGGARAAACASSPGPSTRCARKNARLNLRHLGRDRARVPARTSTARTSSALHHGLATDRLLARWELASPRVARRAAGEAAEPAGARGRRALNEVRLAAAACRVELGPRLDLDAPELLLEIPADWDAVCRADAGARAGVAGGRAPRVRVRLRARLRGRGLRHDAATAPRASPTCCERRHSAPVAAGSCGSDDHSLHEPA